MAKLKLGEALNLLKDTTIPVSNAALARLSNFDAEKKELFNDFWDVLPLERRRKIVVTLADLLEDSVEYDFSTVLYLMLEDEDPQVRGKAIEALWEDETPEFMNQLIEMMTEDDSELVQEKAALALAHFAFLAETGVIKERRAERLREALFRQCEEDFEPLMVARRALEALGYFTLEDRVRKIIERAYQSDDELLKASALKAMGRTVNKRWLPEVGKELSSDDPALRYEAIIAAGEIGTEELIQPMIELTNDDDREVQVMAVWALGQIGGREASRVLNEIAQSEDEDLVVAAKEALSEIQYASNPLNVFKG